MKPKDPTRRRQNLGYDSPAIVANTDGRFLDLTAETLVMNTRTPKDIGVAISLLVGIGAASRALALLIAIASFATPATVAAHVDPEPHDDAHNHGCGRAIDIALIAEDHGWTLAATRRTSPTSMPSATSGRGRGAVPGHVRRRRVRRDPGRPELPALQGFGAAGGAVDGRGVGAQRQPDRRTQFSAAELAARTSPSWSSSATRATRRSAPRCSPTGRSTSRSTAESEARLRRCRRAAGR